MAIIPDTKDWTFVLREICPECGFDVRRFPRHEVGRLIRDNARRWAALLEHPHVAERPSPDVWSGLEYACHVRDVFALYDQRLRRMLEEDDPMYANWDQDTAAVDGAYGDQDPRGVGEDLSENARVLAERFDAVQDEDWERRGRRSDGAGFTVESFARYLIHDPVHHVHDVEKGYASFADR